jgi:hypothetical protein
MQELHIKEVVQICEAMLFEASGTFPTSFRTYYGHALFEKAVRHGRSIISLAETTVGPGPTIKLDVAALCILARCIIEVHNAAAYLLETGISKDESDLRFQLFNLNHSSDLSKIKNRLGIVGGIWVDASLHWSRAELSKNPVFKALDEPLQKKLMRGGSPYVHLRYSGPRPLDPDLESGLYNLFSQSTHSFSLGLTSIVGGGSLTPAGTENQFLLAVDAAMIYLSTVALIYWRLRNRALKALPTDWRNTLENARSTAKLTSRLQKINEQLERVS